MIKTKFATIVNISNKTEQPYYVIRYQRVQDDFVSEGFGSCYLPMILEWLRTEFELIPE